MPKNTKSSARARQRLAPASGAAFLWDESFLWGLMAYRALNGLGLPFDLIKAEDIKTGALNKYKMLFVPGGWASNKIKALGETGVTAIRKFVSDGGSYVGFCGGAGLATTGRDGIGLLNIKRRPTKERVPSFSGRIKLNVNEHQMWKGIPPFCRGNPPWLPGAGTGACPYGPVFQAWWPSQFIVEDNSIKILAKYGDALPDAFSSDLNVGDVESDNRWDELEKVYQINLNPNRLENEPAVIEGTYGKGKVILSLVHFDTPDDVNGQQVLVNLWDYLEAGGRSVRLDSESQGSACRGERPFAPSNKLPHDPAGAIHELPLQNLCADLIFLGERNFLWFWRNSMLLQWRRGVRGLEYNTLYIMMKEISEIQRRGALQYAPPGDRLEDLLVPFVEKSKRLLLLERHALQKGHITYERCDDPEIRKLRMELFSESKSHGGRFKELLDEIDKLLFSLLISPNNAVIGNHPESRPPSFPLVGNLTAGIKGKIPDKPE